MSQRDAPDVIAIIAAHEQIDGELAGRYFEEYFADPVRIASLREVNLVTVVDGETVGVCGYSPGKYDWPDVLWLNWLYVHEKWRKRGIGRWMLVTTLNRLRAMNIRKLFLDTDSDEAYHPAIRLYESLGFEHEGLLRDYYARDEHMVLMGLEL